MHILILNGSIPVKVIIIRVIKSNKIKWAGSSHGGNKKYIQNFCWNNITIDFGRTECEVVS
jgi:hypothetical protein